MPTIGIENKVASQALRGQNVKITVDLSTQSAEFAQLEIGQQCVDNSTMSFVGYVYSIDRYGNSFEICPAQPNLSFLSGVSPGYFIAGEFVDITV